MFSICNCLFDSYRVLELNEKNLLESVQTEMFSMGEWFK